MTFSQMIDSYIHPEPQPPADTRCPECGRSFALFERMQDGNCEVCDAERGAAIDMVEDWDELLYPETTEIQ